MDTTNWMRQPGLEHPGLITVSSPHPSGNGTTMTSTARFTALRAMVIEDKTETVTLVFLHANEAADVLVVADGPPPEMIRAAWASAL